MSIIHGFIVPHPPIAVAEIGRGEESKIEATVRAYTEVARRIRELTPDTIILTSPHAPFGRGHFNISAGSHGRGDFGNFGAGEVSFEATYDKVLAKRIIDMAKNIDIIVAPFMELMDVLDHGTTVPLYFINKEYRNYNLIRISLSGLSLEEHFKLGKVIRSAVETEGRRAVFIASGDLSHVLKEDGPYGFSEEGPVFDRLVTEAVRKGNLKSLMDLDEDFCAGAAECGLRSFIIMAGALDGLNVRSELLSYEGPFGVGYGVASFEVGR